MVYGRFHFATFLRERKTKLKLRTQIHFFILILRSRLQKEKPGRMRLRKKMMYKKKSLNDKSSRLSFCGEANGIRTTLIRQENTIKSMICERLGVRHPPRSSFKGGSIIPSSNTNPALKTHTQYWKEKSTNSVWVWSVSEEDRKSVV